MTDHDTTPLTPEARAKQGADGTAVVMTGGARWLLPDAPCARSLDALRDRIFDGIVRDRSVLTVDAQVAGICLLRYNYDVTHAEALELLRGADPAELAAAVADSLVRPGANRRRQTYSMWVRATLRMNNLDPAAVEPALVPEILEMLVRLGRALPAEDYVDTARHARLKAEVLKQADW